MGGYGENVMRKYLIVPLLIVTIFASCTSTTLTQLKTDLEAVNQVYAAALQWYTANSGSFTPEQQAQFDKLKTTYANSYDALKKSIAAFDASQQHNYAEMLANLASVVFDILSIVRAYGKSNILPLSASITSVTSSEDKKTIVLAMANALNTAHASANNSNCNTCHATK